MHLKSLASLISIFTVATGYSFPSDLGDGTYSVLIKGGEQWHVKLNGEASTNSTAAYQFPQDLADGVYTLSIEKGNDVSLKLEEETATPIRSVGPTSNAKSIDVREIKKRWPSGTTAECLNSWLWSDHFFQAGGAWDQFWVSCTGLKAGAHLVYSSTHYTASSLLCSYHWETFGSYYQSNCDRLEWSDAVNWISSSCNGGTGGWKQGGRLNIPGWEKNYAIVDSGSVSCP